MARGDWEDRLPRDRRQLPSSPHIARPLDQQTHLIPALLILGAVALVALGAVLSVAAHGKEQQVARLRRSGAPVTYVLRQCTSGRNGRQCSGSVTFRHHTYHESISGSVHASKPGTQVAALLDPTQPGSFVYARSSVFGPGADNYGNWYVGGLVSAALAVGLGATAWLMVGRRKRTPTAE
jgi:hypothetical protein